MVKFREMIAFYVGAKYADDFSVDKVLQQKEIKEKVEQGKSIILTGSTGSGKTMSLIYIAYLKYMQYEKKRIILEAEGEQPPIYRVSWHHSSDLTHKIVNDEKVKHNYHDNTIFIDDFGIFPYRTYDKEYFFAQLDALFERVMSSKITCYVSTNFTKEKLEQYTRIISRLKQDGSLFNTGREDRRKGTR